MVSRRPWSLRRAHHPHGDVGGVVLVEGMPCPRGRTVAEERGRPGGEDRVRVRNGGDRVDVAVEAVRAAADRGLAGVAARGRGAWGLAGVRAHDEAGHALGALWSRRPLRPCRPLWALPSGGQLAGLEVAGEQRAVGHLVGADGVSREVRALDLTVLDGLGSDAVLGQRDRGVRVAAERDDERRQRDQHRGRWATDGHGEPPCWLSRHAMAIAPSAHRANAVSSRPRAALRGPRSHSRFHHPTRSMYPSWRKRFPATRRATADATAGPEKAGARRSRLAAGGLPRLIDCQLGGERSLVCGPRSTRATWAAKFGNSSSGPEVST